MGKTTKRLLSFLTALVMVISMMPVNALQVFAAETSEYDVAAMTNEEIVATCIELAEAGDEDAIKGIYSQLSADRLDAVSDLYVAALPADESYGTSALAETTATVTVYKQVSSVTETVVDGKYYELIDVDVNESGSPLENAVTALNNAGVTSGALILISEGTLVVTNRQDITISDVTIKGAGEGATVITGDSSTFNNSTNGLASSSLSSEYKALIGTSTENVKIMDLTVDGGDCGVVKTIYGSLKTVADFKTVRVNGGSIYLENVTISGSKARSNLMVGTSSSSASAVAVGVTVNSASGALGYSDTEFASGSPVTQVDSVLGGSIVGATDDLGEGYYELTSNGVSVYTTIPYVIDLYNEGIPAEVLNEYCTDENVAEGTTVAQAMAADLASGNALYGMSADEMYTMTAAFKTVLEDVAADTDTDVSATVAQLDTAIESNVWGATNIPAPSYVAKNETTGATYDSLAEAVSAASAGDVIVVNANIDSMPTINKPLTIKGAEGADVQVNAVIAENFPDVDGKVSFQNLTFNQRISTENASNDQSKMTLEFVNCTFNIPADNTYAIQAGASWNNDVLGALVVDGCTFNYTGNTFKKGYAVYAQCVQNVTVKNSTIDGNNALRGAIHLGDSTVYATVATIEGNTIQDVARGVQVGNRVEGSSVTLSGNTFDNVNAFEGESESAVVYIHENANVETTSVALTGNDVVNSAAETPVIFSENQTGAVTDFVTTFESNTKNEAAIELEGNYSDAYVPPVNYVAYIDGVGYETLAEAIAAANGMTGDVVVEICGKTEYTDATASLTGAYDSISFVGTTADAEISITRNGSNGYISGEGNDCAVSFTDLILSKPVGAYANDAGFMNVYFSVYRVGDVSYTNCTFPDGACAQGGNVTYTNCEFANQTSGEYSLWVYADCNVTVTGGEFTGVRGAKMFAEGAAKTGNLVMENTTFTASVTEKPAIVLTYGESVTLTGNTYNNVYKKTGTATTFELDLDGAPNGTPVTSDADVTCYNDNGPCGVMVDGNIYTTVADAAQVAVADSTVKLLHDSTETVELAEGVVLDKNGYTADGVTVAAPAYVAMIGQDGYESLAEALEAAINSGESDVTITLVGETSADTQDLFDLYGQGAFDNITIQQDNDGNPYYVLDVYTGSRTSDDGVFTFDGVNIVITEQVFLTGGVELINNSVITRTSDVTNGLYDSIYIEAGSKLHSIIDRMIGAVMYLDGGKTDGTYSTTPDYKSVFVDMWSSSMIQMENGAYMLISSGEGGKLTMTSGTILAYGSKIDVYNEISMTDDSWLLVDMGSTVKAQKITGTGTITIDATDFDGSDVVLIQADMSGFTGTVEVTDNDAAVFEITDAGIVIKQDPAYGKVAKIGDTYYTTMDAALAAAVSGDTITLLADAILTEAIELQGMTLTIDGTAQLDIEDLVTVSGESTLVVTAPMVDLNGNDSCEFNLAHGTVLTDCNVSGDAMLYGKVTFRGDNTFAMIYDYGNAYSTEYAEWIVEKGASLTLTTKARYGLGYGDKVTIYGSIEDALTARENLTEEDRSLFTHGLVAMSNWDVENSVTVKDAYVVIGSHVSFGNSASSKHTGTFTFDFENTILDASRITFYAANSVTTFNLTDSDAKVGTFMTRDADSVFTLTNSVLLSTTTSNGTDEGNYHAGKLVLVDSALTYSAPLVMEGGVIEMDLGSLITAPSIIGTGKIVVDATGFTGISTFSATGANGLVLIDADMSGFEGTIEVEGAVCTVDENGLTIIAAEAAIGDTCYATLAEAVAAAGEGDTITVLSDITLEKTVHIYAGDKVTIDLNGKTINYNPDAWVYGAANSGTALLTVDFGGDLTIEDSSAEKTGTLDASYAVGFNSNTYDVYSAVMMTGKGDDAANGTAKLTVNGGTLLGYFSAIAGNKDRDDTEIVINGGTVKAGISTGYTTSGIEHPMNGKLTINGGLIEGMDGISLRSGTLLVTGGTIKGTAPESAFDDPDYFDNNFAVCTGNALQIVNRENSNAAYQTPSVSIVGGTFISENTDAVGSYAGYKGETPDTLITGFISGGSFNTDVTDLCAAGYVCQDNGDGTFGIEKDPYAIATLEDLKAFRDMVNAGDRCFGETWYLAADIDLLGEEWTPIGSNSNPFQGTFDGQGLTISNLVITGRNEMVGLFGRVNNTGGEIKNLTIHNANITGDSQIGALVGSPGTFKISNIKVTGHVEIDGYQAVGAVGGKNANADWDNVIVDVDDTSFVKAISTVDGTQYTTHVGGVIGMNGNIAHSLTNISSNIKVIGDVKYIGGLFGTVNSSNTIENVTFTGTVEAAEGAIKVGAIAGVWVNAKDTSVIINNADYDEGTVTVGGESVDAIVGGTYYDYDTAETSGTLLVDGVQLWPKTVKVDTEYYDSLAEAIAAAENGDTIELLGDIELTERIKVTGKDLTLKGNGCAISGTGALWFAGGAATIENVVFKNNTFTGNFGLLEFTNTAAKDVKVTNCTFESNNVASCIAVDTNAYNNGASVATVSGCTFTGNNCSTAVINSSEGTLTAKDNAFVGNTVTGAAVIYTSTDSTITGNYFAENDLSGLKGAVVAGPYRAGEFAIEITGNAFTDANVPGAYVEDWEAAYGAVNAYDLNGNYWGGEAPNYGKSGDPKIALDNYYTVYDYTDGVVTLSNEVEISYVAQVGNTKYETLDALFAAGHTGEVTVELLADASTDNVVSLPSSTTYNFVTNVAGGVTMTWNTTTKNWNYLRSGSIGQGVTLNVPVRFACTSDLTVSGTINTGYAYFLGADVVIEEGAALNVTSGEKTVQVKGAGMELTVHGTVNTSTLNVWASDAKLIVSGENAQVNASWIDIWDGAPSVLIENGATIDTDAIKVSRGGEISVNDANLTAESIEVGHNTTSAGVLTETGNSSISGEIKMTGTGSVVNSDGGLDVTTSIADHKVVYDEQSQQYKVVAKVYVAQIGETKYESLQDAVDAAQDGEVITVLEDVTLSAMLFHDSGTNITIEGAGKTITFDNTEYGIAVKNSGLTLGEGLNVVALGDTTALYVQNGTAVTSANLTASGVYATIITNGGYSADVTVNGGTVTHTGGENAIYWPSQGKLTVNGGEITGATGIYCKSGELEITGGTITGNGAKADYGYVVSGSNPTGDAVVVENVGNDGYEAITSVSITGGTFVSANAAAVASYTAGIDGVEAVTGFIADGSFSSDVSELCVPGYEATVNAETGLYEITEDADVIAVNENTGAEYDTLADALAAAAEGETVKVMQDTAEAVLIVNAGTTLDLNGKTVTVASGILGYGEIVDNTADKSVANADNIGLVKTAATTFVLMEENNSQMPIYDADCGGYRFFSYNFEKYATQKSGSTGVRFWFKLSFGGTYAYTLIDDLAAAKLSLTMKLSWTGHESPITHVMSDSVLSGMIKNVLVDGKDPTSQGAYVTVIGVDTLAADSSIFSTPIITSSTGVGCTAETMEYVYTGA